MKKIAWKRLYKFGEESEIEFRGWVGNYELFAYHLVENGHSFNNYVATWSLIFQIGDYSTKCYIFNDPKDCRKEANKLLQNLRKELK